MAVRSTRPPAPGIKDVARAAGVSHQTVSRVLNGLPHVATSTRTRVESAIEELGYQRNTIARNLRTRNSLTIGILTTNLAGYWQMQALLGVEGAARSAGYFVSIASMSSTTMESAISALERFTQEPVVGVIVLTPHQNVLSALEQIAHPVPLVIAGCSSSGKHLGVDSQQRLGARLAVQHLLDQGHTRIGHLSGPLAWHDAVERAAGWQDALQAAGLEAGTLIEGDWSARRGYEVAMLLQSMRSVTAMFVANDQMALGLLRGFQESGLKIPQEFGIVGYGDQPEASYFCPPLTTIRHDLELLGSLCVEALLNRETDRLRDIPTPSPLLIVRSTSARLCA